MSVNDNLKVLEEVEKEYAKISETFRLHLTLLNVMLDELNIKIVKIIDKEKRRIDWELEQQFKEEEASKCSNQ